jgi:hypothetical protein
MMFNNCLEKDYLGAGFEGQFRFIFNQFILGGATYDPDDFEQQQFLNPKDLDTPKCKLGGEDAKSQDECCMGNKYCPSFGKCIQATRGGEPC